MSLFCQAALMNTENQILCLSAWDWQSYWWVCFLVYLFYFLQKYILIKLADICSYKSRQINPSHLYFKLKLEFCEFIQGAEVQVALHKPQQEGWSAQCLRACLGLLWSPISRRLLSPCFFPAIPLGSWSICSGTSLPRLGKWGDEIRMWRVKF